MTLTAKRSAAAFMPAAPRGCASWRRGLPRTCPRAVAVASAAFVRWEITASSLSARAAYRCSRNGSTSAPRSATKVTGLGKTTLTRAIKAGRLSATRREDGSYAIDPNELSRVYKVKPETAETVTATGYTAHRTTPDGEASATPRDPDVHTLLAVAKAEVRHPGVQYARDLLT